ncbi:hypothetical protein PDE_08283 [Penicillium oxalicum 114-2]|uniref:Uncharacterized protein n=1 Tax=Penicillium oxalicum (strain 114-2 / CGMCC 5302) TaxID=933388 RepID=S7ZX53_PENO1|nr:hypothetical protein PDE_08283 [Penicillium oxalicum 114-2]
MSLVLPSHANWCAIELFRDGLLIHVENVPSPGGVHFSIGGVALNFHHGGCFFFWISLLSISPLRSDCLIICYLCFHQISPSSLVYVVYPKGSLLVCLLLFCLFPFCLFDLRITRQIPASLSIPLSPLFLGVYTYLPLDDSID